MKAWFITIAFAALYCTASAYNNKIAANITKTAFPADSVKLLIDGKNGNNGFYQKTLKTDSGITIPMIYLRAMQFMASKNFIQTYGYQEEGKLIFTTTQDLNVAPVSISDDEEEVAPYTVQFAVTIDIKKRSYRYTIHNIVFFLPTQYGNKRETMYDIYLKAYNSDSRRIAKAHKKLIDSFERYISSLTDELYQGIAQKSLIYSKF